MPVLIAGALALLALVWGVVQNVVSILIRPIMQHLNQLDPTLALPAADAADGVERTRWTYAEGQAEAEKWGVAPDAFARMVELVGEPPPLDEMRSLEMRGALGPGELQTMYEYSRARNEWFDVWRAAAFRSMSAADALTARVKGVIDDGAARGYFENAGGIADQYDALLSTTGDSIGVVEAGSLFMHGKITHADLQAVIKHSRINPQFEPMAELQRFHWLSVIQIGHALTAGAITSQQATEWLTQEGYPADQVAGFVAYGAHTKVAAHKQLAESQITELYEAGVIDGPTASADLEALGYDSAEVAFILSLYDQRKLLAMVNAVTNLARKTYLAGLITADEVTADLTALGVAGSTIQNYLAIWDIEHQAEIRTLTMAEVGALVKATYITPPDAMHRWQMMGYNVTDATLLLAHYAGVAPDGSPAPTV